MRSLPALLLLLCACSRHDDVLEELPNSSLAGAPREIVREEGAASSWERPITIGEDGPRLDACGAMGQVVRTGASGLALRAAPLDDAREVARLAQGARLHVCTRSLDQKWLGVVVEPAEGAGESCGVTDPVDQKQAYAGPCVSGWTSSASVQLIAG